MSADQITDSDPLQRHLLCRATGEESAGHKRFSGTIGSENEGGPGAGETAPDRGQHLVGGAVMANRKRSSADPSRRRCPDPRCTRDFCRHLPLEVILAERTKVDDAGCFVWAEDRRNAEGYGRLGPTVAHRIVWEKVNGPIPDGLVLDHLCRNRACVNPAHLEVVSQQVNILRGVGPSAVNATLDACRRGHPLEGDNLYMDPSGRRVCRTCRRDRKRRYYDPVERHRRYEEGKR